MIRITIIADRVEELRQFLQRTAADAGPRTFKSISELPLPSGSYKPRHAKKDRSR